MRVCGGVCGVTIVHKQPGNSSGLHIAFALRIMSDVVSVILIIVV